MKIQIGISFKAGQKAERDRIFSEVEKRSHKQATNMLGISLSKSEWQEIKEGDGEMTENPREKIRNTIKDYCKRNQIGIGIVLYRQANEMTDQILALLSAELEKLTVLGDKDYKEVVKYIPIPEHDLRKVAQAQLYHIIRQLKDLLK